MSVLSENTIFSHSMKLFQFCLGVLERRRPAQKTNDQHLGKLIHFSPSDTSHWKHGRKKFKDTKHIATLSKSLKIDPIILQEILDGSMTLDEAWYEFNESEESQQFQASYTLKERIHQIKLGEECANKILKEADLKSIPVNLNELMKAFPYIQLLPNSSVSKLATSSRIKPGNYVIRFAKGKLTPYTHVAIMREIAHIILTAERARYNLPFYPVYTAAQLKFDVVILSNALLIPNQFLVTEMEKLSTSPSLLATLADIFFVPKSVMHKRLTALLNQSAVLLN